MKVLTLIILLSSPFCFAAEPTVMKAGLWNIELKMTDAEGKESNPMAALQEMIDKLPEDKKKEFMALMEKSDSAPISKEGISTCYTKEMLKDLSALAKQDEENCTSKIIISSPTGLKTKFTCKDGSFGDSTWKVKDPSTYEGKVNVETPKIGKSSLNYIGKFVSEDCGKVKPEAASSK